MSLLISILKFVLFFYSCSMKHHIVSFLSIYSLFVYLFVRFESYVDFFLILYSIF